MPDKEINIAILQELKRIANEIFTNGIAIEPGTYTAAELSKGKDAKGNVIGINYIQVQTSVLLWSVLIGVPGMNKGAIMRKLTHTATQIRGPAGERLSFYNSINTLKKPT